jgi:hypothetical protein
MDKKREKPKMSVEVDGKVILEMEMDKDNADWIRAARRERERSKSDGENGNLESKDDKAEP